MNTPELTADERKEALEKAVAVRRARAKVMDGLRSGGMSVSDVIGKGRAGDPICGKIRVEKLIRALPGWGEARADRIMREIGIAQGRRVAGLGHRQTEALLRALR